MFVHLFICWNLNAVGRNSKVHKQSLGLMIEELFQNNLGGELENKTFNDKGK